MLSPPTTLEAPSDLLLSVTNRVRQTVRTQTRGDFHDLTFRAMSTPVRICFGQQLLPLAADFQRAAVEWIARFEARYSRFIADSIVGQINAAAGTGDWIEVDDETEELLHLCGQMHELTSGAFDAATLPLLRL